MHAMISHAPRLHALLPDTQTLQAARVFLTPTTNMSAAERFFNIAELVEIVLGELAVDEDRICVGCLSAVALAQCRRMFQRRMTLTESRIHLNMLLDAANHHNVSLLLIVAPSLRH